MFIITYGQDTSNGGTNAYTIVTKTLETAKEYVFEYLRLAIEEEGGDSYMCQEIMENIDSDTYIRVIHYADTQVTLNKDNGIELYLSFLDGIDTYQIEIHEVQYDKIYTAID